MCINLKACMHLWARRSCTFSRTVPAHSAIASTTLQKSSQIIRLAKPLQSDASLRHTVQVHTIVNTCSMLHQHSVNGRPTLSPGSCCMMPKHCSLCGPSLHSAVNPSYPVCVPSHYRSCEGHRKDFASSAHFRFPRSKHTLRCAFPTKVMTQLRVIRYLLMKGPLLQQTAPCCGTALFLWQSLSRC